jgi:hypothetical protein
MRKYLVKYEEAVSHIRFCSAPFWISTYMRKILFSFVSVHFPYESGMSDFSTNPLDRKYKNNFDYIDCTVPDKKMAS